MNNKIIKIIASLWTVSYRDKVKNNKLQLNWTATYSILCTNIIITGLLLVIRQLGGLQLLELIAYDLMVRWQKNDQLDPRILLVKITESDIQRQNRWPLADITIAQLLKQLQQHQPRVIGLDIHRNIAHPPGSQALQQQLQADNVIVIEELGSGNNYVPPPPNVPETRVGFNDLVPDADNKLRRNLLYARMGEEKLYSFALRLSLHYLQDYQLEFEAKPNSLQIGETIFMALNANSGGYQMQPTEALGWQVLLNYRSPQIAPELTLTEVLEGRFNPSLIKNKVVLIGNTAPSFKDFFYTPYGGKQTVMPGVLIHAQMVSQILSTVLDDSPLFWFWSQWLESVWIWVWSLIGAAIAWQIRHPLWQGVAIIISLGSLWTIGYLCFLQAGWIPVVPPGLGLIITAACILATKVVYTAFYDSLTGLPNRSLFTKRLKRLKHQPQIQGKLIAILCLDLDRFKLINDGLGYQAGDQLLITTASSLKAYLSPQDILARVGPDEFAIALRQIDDASQAIQFAYKLEKELNIPFQLDGEDTFTTVSIGIASNKVDQNLQPEDLLLAAYTAMYKAQLSGKANHEVFASRMHEQALARLQLEADLREAIEQQEFELHYQPIISLDTGKIAGFESLIRWNSPKRGFVSPGAFIPVTEETSLIVPLGQWILEEACNQICYWRKQFTNYPSLLITVNLSGRQFSQPDLVEQIEQILTNTGLERDSLKLEITESMVMDDVENAIALLHHLKALGLQLSMDDFGTGFSSFSYLHRFPMDTLKVDRSFVSNMSQSQKNQEIVSTIVMLAHKLGMVVVAEGIETEAEMKALKLLNCEYGQGYFFSKPVSVDQATKLLKDNPQW